MKIDIWQDTREKAIIEEKSGIKYLIGESALGKPTLKVWLPKANKPYVNYYYNSMEELNNRLSREIEKGISYKKMINDRKEARRINPLTITLKKGDLFYTSWGYDQTNYDFIVVLSVKGLFATCQRTHTLNMGHDGGCCDVKEPIYMPFGEVFKMKVCKGYQGEFSLRGSYPFCNDGTGSKRLDTFSPHTVGKQYHETDAYSGH